MLSYTCPAALRETKHNPACRQAGTQDFFKFFIDLKKGTIPITRPTTTKNVSQTDFFLLVTIPIIITMHQSNAAHNRYQTMRSFPVIESGMDSIQNILRLACINTAINKLPVCL